MQSTSSILVGNTSERMHTHHVPVYLVSYEGYLVLVRQRQDIVEVWQGEVASARVARIGLVGFRASSSTQKPDLRP